MVCRHHLLFRGVFRLGLGIHTCKTHRCAGPSADREKEIGVETNEKGQENVPGTTCLGEVVRTVLETVARDRSDKTAQAQGWPSTGGDPADSGHPSLLEAASWRRTGAESEEAAEESHHVALSQTQR